jgi:hypothetical protein
MTTAFARMIERANDGVLRHLADSEITIEGVVSTPAVWREPHELALSAVNAADPVAMIAADAYPELTRGLLIERAGVEYRVIGVEADGLGLVSLRLERAA